MAHIGQLKINTFQMQEKMQVMRTKLKEDINQRELFCKHELKFNV